MPKRYLVRYNVSLPNKAVLLGFCILGASLIAAAIIVAVRLIIWWRTSDLYESYGYGRPNQPPFDGWYFIIPVLILIAGIALAAWFGTKFYDYYRYVKQGRIVFKDIEGGGFSPLSYFVEVEGYTFANELRRSRHYVNAGWWHEVKVGEFVSFTR